MAETDDKKARRLEAQMNRIKNRERKVSGEIERTTEKISGSDQRETIQNGSLQTSTAPSRVTQEPRNAGSRDANFNQSAQTGSRMMGNSRAASNQSGPTNSSARESARATLERSKSQARNTGTKGATGSLEKKLGGMAGGAVAGPVGTWVGEQLAGSKYSKYYFMIGTIATVIFWVAIFLSIVLIVIAFAAAIYHGCVVASNWTDKVLRTFNPIYAIARELGWTDGLTKMCKALF